MTHIMASCTLDNEENLVTKLDKGMGMSLCTAYYILYVSRNLLEIYCTIYGFQHAPLYITKLLQCLQTTDQSNCLKPAAHSPPVSTRGLENCYPFCMHCMSHFYTPAGGGRPPTGCPLDHMCIYIIYNMFVCTTMLKYTLHWRYMNWRCKQPKLLKMLNKR